MCPRTSETIAASGPLAVRDGAEHILSRSFRPCVPISFSTFWAGYDTLQHSSDSSELSGHSSGIFEDERGQQPLP